MDKITMELNRKNIQGRSKEKFMFMRKDLFGKGRANPITFSLAVFSLVLLEGVFFIHLNSLINQQTFELERVERNVERSKEELSNLEAESARLSSIERIELFLGERRGEFVPIPEYIYLPEVEE